MAMNEPFHPTVLFITTSPTLFLTMRLVRYWRNIGMTIDFSGFLLIECLGECVN